MEREEGESVESKAEGTSASAMTNRTGAENRRSEITMVSKKNTVFTPHNTFFDFSSFEKKPIFYFSNGT